MCNVLESSQMPHPWYMGKLSSTKPAPGAKKVAGHWIIDYIFYILYTHRLAPDTLYTVYSQTGTRYSVYCVFTDWHPILCILCTHRLAPDTLYTVYSQTGTRYSMYYILIDCVLFCLFFFFTYCQVCEVHSYY